MNIRNDGAIPNLADDCIVETPVFVDELGIHVPRQQPLSQACAATCQVSINVQRMAKDAALTGDILLLKQAMLHDPLVGAVCDPDEVWQMTDDMLLAQKEWLPQYADGIAKLRPAVNGNRRPLRPIEGTLRKKVKSIDDLRNNHDELAWLATTGKSMD